MKVCLYLSGLKISMFSCPVTGKRRSITIFSTSTWGTALWCAGVSSLVACWISAKEKDEETRFLVSWEVFAKQSETFLLFSPDLNVARARTLAYFQEVEQDTA